MKNGALPRPACSGTAISGRRRNIIISSAVPAAQVSATSAPAAVGAALANRDKGIITVSIEGDGDLMYAPGVLWTAAHHKIPLLMMMHNNRAYHQEVMHLQKMAGLHNRRMDTAAIGTTIDNPNIDLRQAGAIHGRSRRGTDHESRCHRSGAIPRSGRSKARRAGAGRCSFPRTLREELVMRKLVSAALLVLTCLLDSRRIPRPAGFCGARPTEPT